MSDLNYLGLMFDTHFINYVDLSEKVGLASFNGTLKEKGWLHFRQNGKSLYLASRPVVWGVSWETLSDLGLISGLKTIDIDGKLFKVRLPKGTSTPHTSTRGGFELPVTIGSEWDTLFSLVHSGEHTDDIGAKLSTISYSGNLGDRRLMTHRDHGYGSRSWCQELVKGKAVAVQRGYMGVHYLVTMATGNTSIASGWRPIIEEV